MPDTDKKEKMQKVLKALPVFLLLAIIIGIYIYICVFKDDSENKILNIFGRSSATSEESSGDSVLPEDKANIEDLVCLIYSEVNNYNDEAKQGVASIVFNRVKNGDFKNNVHDVIYQPAQFKSVSQGSIVSYDAIPEDDRKKIQSIIEKARHEDNTNGALFYYSPADVPKYVTSSDDLRIRQMVGVTVIDNVVFMTTYPY